MRPWGVAGHGDAETGSQRLHTGHELRERQRLLGTGPHNTGRGGAPTEDTGLGDDEHPAGPPKGLAGEEGRMTTCDARVR